MTRQMDEGQKATDSSMQGKSELASDRASSAFIPKARDSGAAFSTETARWMDGWVHGRRTDERTVGDRGRS